MNNALTAATHVNRKFGPYVTIGAYAVIITSSLLSLKK